MLLQTICSYCQPCCSLQTQNLSAVLQQQFTGGALMLVSHLTEGHRHVVQAKHDVVYPQPLERIDWYLVVEQSRKTPPSRLAEFLWVGGLQNELAPMDDVPRQVAWNQNVNANVYCV